MNKRQLGRLIDRLDDFDCALIEEGVDKDSLLRRAVTRVNNEMVRRYEKMKHPSKQCPRKQSP